MAPPRLAAEQIVCGPDFADERDRAGRWLSLKTPAGEYDLSTVLARLPEEQKPDVVVCLVDAARRSLPRNLGSFKGPRVLLVADTHHLKSPLIGMLRYATAEPFTRTVLLYDRHHASIFHSAGVRNLHWFPGLTLPHDDSVVGAVRKPARVARIGFVGQAGAFHPRRARILTALTQRNLPVVIKALPQAEGLKFYGESLLGLNTSLNGDLNLRVFEILASGAALVTDRLAPQSGLAALLTEGRECLAYDGIEDLADTLIDALAQPERTRDIGQAGAAWFDLNFNATLRQAQFARLVQDGVSPDRYAFSAEEKTHVHFAGDLGRLLRSVVAYEQVQELHRTQERVTIALPASAPADVASLLTTLPRVTFDSREADLVIVDRSQSAPIVPAPALWCWDAAPSDGLLDASLVGAGYLRAHATAPIYRRRAEPVRTSDGRRHVLLYTDDPESGGVAQYNHTLLLALVQAGYRVSCVQSRVDNPLVKEQREAGVTHHWIDYHTGTEFGRTLADANLAGVLFREDPPDLIIFSDCCPLSNLAAREVARKLGLAYVCVEGFVGAYLADKFTAQLPVLERQYVEARAVVAVSEENRGLLVARFGAPADRTRVIHYGRPERFFQPRNEATRARLRAELGLPTDAVVSLTTARLTAIKGFQHQLKALLHLKRKRKARNLHLVWAGDGDQRAKLESAVKETGLADQVHFIGHRWDVADWYDAADIFVLTSHMEGMPLSIMEAMAKGLPVAASAVSGIPEELGDTGRLLADPKVSPDRTVTELAQTLERWTGDAKLLRSVGDEGQRRAHTMYREQRMTSRTIELVAHAMEVASVEPVPRECHTAT